MCLLQKFDIFKVQLQKYLTSRNVRFEVKHEIVTTFLSTNESDLGMYSLWYIMFIVFN